MNEQGIASSYQIFSCRTPQITEASLATIDWSWMDGAGGGEDINFKQLALGGALAGGIGRVVVLTVCGFGLGGVVGGFIHVVSLTRLHCREGSLTVGR